MESRPWRRKSVPPMPALIPISALRGGGKSPCAANSNNNQDNNNEPDCNDNVLDCVPCERIKGHHEDVISDIEEEKHLVSSGDESDTVRLERCRRRSFETLGRRCSIDVETASVSRDCQAPCATYPARRTSSPSALIRPARTERHRKSDRRRRLHHRRRASTTITNITQPEEEEDLEKSNTKHHQSAKTEPKQPRVNPIFVWVRQEDTRIVDVKCEDYDKRNRILLTKTAHGWRAIPRTETLTGTLEEKPAKTTPSTHHKHERSKSGPGRPPKNKKSRRRRESSEKHTSAESESQLTEPEVLVDNPAPESPWSRVEQDIESHLPSHTITIPKRHRSTRTSCEENLQNDNINKQSPIPELRSEVEEMVSDNKCVNSIITQARTPTPESALETLLAAAEIAFKNQIIEQSNNPETLNEISADFINKPIEESVLVEKPKVDSDLIIMNNDCDYNELDEEDDTNQFADVLDKLEQSLQSPEENEINANDIQDIERQLMVPEDEEICPETPEAYQEEQEGFLESQEDHLEIPEPEELADLKNIEQEQQQEQEQEQELEQEQDQEQQQEQEQEQEQEVITPEEVVERTELIEVQNEIVEEDLQPTDLSIHSSKKVLEVVEEPQILQEVVDDMQPTDLSIKKHSTALTIEPICRPPSQNSETIQSPQPSGIPAVPPSPDITTINKSNNNNNNNSTKQSVFLESLLSTSPKIMTLNSEITITRNHKEPLDLGKGRKSASPTVSCSEEAKNIGEPTPKRCKVEDITLKNLLHAEDKKPEVTIKAIPMERPSSKPVMKDQSSRLLELLTSDTVPDPMTQLKQLLAEPHINIPDPMLVPKDRLSHILAAPSKEIPRLLVTRPELRLPEALGHPTLMNDPDILVITMDQLHTILEKHQQPLSLEETKQQQNKIESVTKENNNKVPNTCSNKPVQQQHQKSASKTKNQNNHQQSREVMNHQAIANDYHRYIQNLQHQQQLMLQEAQIKHHQNQMMRKPSGLANDIDAATAASFNQMMWLPYLSQLEQAASVTGNNTEFLKMLNAVFPNGTYPGPADLLPPMFGGGRFIPNNLPMPQPLDYNLEMSMWQEAMLRSNKLPSEALLPKHANTNNYRDNNNLDTKKNNKTNKFLSGGVSMLNGHPNGFSHLNGHQNSPLSAQKQQRSSITQGTGFSSARTNPLMAEQQLIGMKNPFFRPNVQSLRPNIQVPTFNSDKLHHSSLLERHKPTPADKLADKFNLSLKSNPFFTPKEKTKTSSNSFLHEVSLTKLPEPFKPMDLSSNQPKLKVRTNLMAGGFSFGREEAEVGSTTEDALHSLHEVSSQNNHHVWHPLFGK